MPWGGEFHLQFAGEVLAGELLSGIAACWWTTTSYARPHLKHGLSDVVWP
ncbi:hypothetical protein ABT099_21435 [Streptomyces prasinus]